MIFDPPIVLYIVISFSVVIITLALLWLLKKQNIKDSFLKFFAVMSFLIHISSLWVDYLSHGYAFVKPTMIFPIYFCNLNMILLLVVAFIKDKKSKVFRILAEYVFFAGSIGAIIATLFSEFYNANPNLFDYYVFKSLLSHTFLLLGSAYLAVGGYIKIRVTNVLSFLVGIVICVYDGFMIETIFKIAGLPEQNAMYLIDGPLSGAPWLSCYMIFLWMTAFIFIFTAIWEQVSLDKKDRWYSKIQEHIKQRRKR